MHKLFRSLLVLASCALSCALFGGSINVNLDPGERIEISVSGTTHGEVFVTNTATGQRVATIYLASYNPGSWESSYFYNGSVNSPGASFIENNSASGSIVGLPAGNYQIEAYGAGSMIDDYVYESDYSSYIYQRGLYGYNDAMMFAFDIW